MLILSFVTSVFITVTYLFQSLPSVLAWPAKKPLRFLLLAYNKTGAVGFPEIVKRSLDSFGGAVRILGGSNIEQTSGTHQFGKGLEHILIVRILEREHDFQTWETVDSFLIDPLGGHGVESIGDRHDPGIDLHLGKLDP